MVAPLIRKLERLGPLPDEGRRALEGLPLAVEPVEADRDLFHEGEHPRHCLLLLAGLACRYKTTEDGRRQILSFHLPGDLLDLTGLSLGEIDHGIGALTPVEVAPVPHATVLDWMESRPRLGLGRLLWRDAMIDAAIWREWVVNVGRRTARQRVAHLMCELALRLRVAGLARDDICDLPVTQRVLADATGLSEVHMSRTLQELRGAGLIEFGGGTLVVRDWERLKDAGSFDPRYLHQLAAAA